MYLSREQFNSTAFAWYDYLLLIVMVIISVVIGIYFGFFGKKQDNKKEYLLGGKTMAVFPVAVSLIASSISGITTLSYPADVYKYGSNVIWLCLTMPFICLIQSYVFLPIFFQLELTSMYEYLQLRFDKKCRIFASFMFSIVMLFFNAFVIYIPSIAFSQATNIDIHYIAVCICVICIFYTTIGGLKAVIWTDAVQFVGMIVSSVGVVVVGFKVVGGIEKVYNENLLGQRLDIFNFKFDITSRDNFWVIALAGTVQWGTYIIVTQSCVQKCLSLPNLAQAKRAMFLFGFGLISLLFCMVLIGNIMYSRYKNCDPLSAHLVSRHDQLVPYFVIDISDQLPGLLGIFMAGCFCAALSTFSSVLNTLASTIYEDFLSTWLSTEIKKKRESCILKSIVLTTGILSTALIFIIEKSAEIFPIAAGLQGITLGPIMGLFTMGALIPMVTAQAAFFSAITSFLFVAWIGFGNILNSMNGNIKDVSKPLSTEGCSINVNVSQTTTNYGDVFILYQISFWYNVVIGTGVTVLLGIVLSLITKKDDKPFNKNLFSPVIHYFLK